MSDNSTEFSAIAGEATVFVPTTTSNQGAFEDVLNEWLGEVQRRLHGNDLAAIGVATTLGLLGQRLIFQAYQLGQESVITRLQKVRDADRV